MTPTIVKKWREGDTVFLQWDSGFVYDVELSINPPHIWRDHLAQKRWVTQEDLVEIIRLADWNV